MMETVYLGEHAHEAKRKKKEKETTLRSSPLKPHQSTLVTLCILPLSRVFDNLFFQFIKMLKKKQTLITVF
jgi:hypothetical protein